MDLFKDRLACLGAEVQRAVTEKHLREERSRTEEALQPAHEKLTRLLANNPAVIYTLNLQSPTPAFPSGGDVGNVAAKSRAGYVPPPRRNG